MKKTSIEQKVLQLQTIELAALHDLADQLDPVKIKEQVFSIDLSDEAKDSLLTSFEKELNNSFGPKPVPPHIKQEEQKLYIWIRPDVILISLIKEERLPSSLKDKPLWIDKITYRASCTVAKGKALLKRIAKHLSEREN